jgi:hypothetical protein
MVLIPLSVTMARKLGFVPDKERKIVRCDTCWRKYTKFMSIKIFWNEDIYKCIRCYNGGNKNGK